MLYKIEANEILNMSEEELLLLDVNKYSVRWSYYDHEANRILLYEFLLIERKDFMKKYKILY